MSNKFSAVLAHAVSMGTLFSYIAVLGNLILNAPNDQIALHYLIYLSVGISLMNFGYAAYLHFHPSKSPHSAKSALLYTLFYGGLYIINDLTKNN